MPEQALVISRYDPAAPRTAHYALVCYSQRPLDSSSTGRQITLGALRNLLTGRPVGTSQVTAVVEYDAEREHRPPVYEVTIEAELVAPYFIRLQDPIPVLRSLGELSLGEFDFAAVRAEIRRATAGSGPHQLHFALPARNGREH